jgi:hypothetical protein
MLLGVSNSEREVPEAAFKLLLYVACQASVAVGRCMRTKQLCTPIAC